jgi:hypothetical protein
MRTTHGITLPSPLPPSTSSNACAHHMRLRPSVTVTALYLLCSQFVSHHFACPDIPLPSALPSTTQTPRLDHFIAYALHRTRLHPSVTFAALYLLQRLKARFPATKGSSGDTDYLFQHSCLLRR